MAKHMLYTDGMENTQQIDPQTLQNLLGNSSVNPANLIPESLMSMLTVGLMVSIGLMVVFLVLYGLSIMRKWKVQSAVLNMQKDVAEIKQALVKQPAPQVSPPRGESQKIEVAANE